MNQITGGNKKHDSNTASCSMQRKLERFFKILDVRTVTIVSRNLSSRVLSSLCASKLVTSQLGTYVSRRQVPGRVFTLQVASIIALIIRIKGQEIFTGRSSADALPIWSNTLSLLILSSPTGTCCLGSTLLFLRHLRSHSPCLAWVLSSPDRRIFFFFQDVRCFRCCQSRESSNRRVDLFAETSKDGFHRHRPTNP